MKRQARPLLSKAGQHTLDQYRQALQQFEEISPVTFRNYLGDLRQFIVWCEDCWHKRQEERSFTPQAVAPTLLIRYREYLQTSLCLKPSTVNRTLMSLKRYFAWTRKTRLIQSDPARPIKFLPKVVATPRHLSDEEEDALVATVNATGTLRDQVIIILLLHTALCAQEFRILPVRSVAFSPDGKILVSGSNDQTVRLWEVKSGQCLNTLYGHSHWIRSVAFSPDHKALASGSYDGVINLWDRWTGTCLRTLRSERPYGRMNITQVKGLTEGQRATLRLLGAVEDDKQKQF